MTRSNTDRSSPLTVHLASSNTGEAAVPVAVIIPANAASATFLVTAVDDGLLDETQTVTISVAAPGYVPGSTTVDVSDSNRPPTITAIADQTSAEDTLTGPLAFTVGDRETAAGVFLVTAASSNLTLVPNARIGLGGTATNRTITLTPAFNQFGTATITVTVADGDGARSPRRSY